MGLQATVKGQLIGVQGPSLPASSVRLDADLKYPRGSYTIAVTEGPYQKTMLAGDVVLTDGQRLTLRRLHVQHQELAWENDGPIEVVRSAHGTLQVQRLLLRSGPRRSACRPGSRPQGLLRPRSISNGCRCAPPCRRCSPTLPHP